MIKRYLMTFKGDSTKQIARRFAFIIFTLLFSLLFALYFASAKTFDNPYFALVVDLTLGLTVSIITDVTGGIGRKSPFDKN